MTILTNILIITILAALAVIDVQKRIVPNLGTVLIAALGLWRVLAGIVSPGSAAGGAALLGVTMLMLAAFTGGVGGGDVKLLAALGWAVGALQGAKLLFLSFFLSGIFSTGLKIVPVFVENSRLSGIREIPFVPFIALAAALIFF
ncbi:MAG: prepilin peptidase [Firmicutes bacterium]|nr:prepilin peptidase [Bacillota bacterium]